ncbi:MAG: aspartate aminotransferase family protein [Anaerolineales bacterium]|nr:MAG: aspartate aminotransferase family protein [Anaerolineales bacterium]
MSQAEFEKLFISRTRRSRALFDEACKILPGGVAGNGKFKQPYPIYIEEAKGANLRDVDGNEYIDLLMGAGVHILGHGPACVINAVTEQLPRGMHFYLPALPEVRLAQKIIQLMPHLEMMRFVNSGTEATMMALRAARAYRGRDMIARFEGNFHGQHDFALVSTIATGGPPDYPQPKIDCAGIPQSVADAVLVLPYNDPVNAPQIIEEHADQLGAVIMELFSGFGLGCVPGEIDFLKGIREVTSKHDIPLIFDEVVTGFRLGLGGATEYFKVTPDLVSLGKIITGGISSAGYGGSRRIMEKVVTPKDGEWDLQEQIFQSGTFSGNPLSMTAGLAVLEELEKGEVLPYLDKLSDRLRRGLEELAKRSDLGMLVMGVKSIFQVHFGVEKITNRREAMKADKDRAKEFHMGLMANGICASPHPLFLSFAHTNKDVDRILEVCEEVLSQMAK